MDEGIKGSGFIHAGGWSLHLSGLAQCPVTTVCLVFSFNSISNSSPGWGTPQLVCMCVGGPDVSSWARTRGSVCPGASSWGTLSERGHQPGPGSEPVCPWWHLEPSTGEPVRASRCRARPAGEQGTCPRMILMSNKQSGRRICAVDGPRPTEQGQDWYLEIKKKRKENEIFFFFVRPLAGKVPLQLSVSLHKVFQRCAFQCVFAKAPLTASVVMQPQRRAVPVVSTQYPLVKRNYISFSQEAWSALNFVRSHTVVS